MALRALVGIAAIAVVVVSGVWLTDRFYPVFEESRREQQRAQQARERAEWEATPEGQCATLEQADQQYRQTGNVTALPMRYAEFLRALEECRARLP